ncbi:hypothetical protein DDT52_16360 [Brenneria roseae subsp. roseae]|uniref:hypothetical protein n=1 Tax=Brenneria roseae TaxID=1509241 RepID=UPI000D6183BE|nr:hypothetical protein [Brenneria roseae]PWC17115.1 hypothetical protein DDT52_16360 [Brenneria roseae subsp. roseae]
MLSFISGPLFNGCGGVSVIATTRYELGCDERGRDLVLTQFLVGSLNLIWKLAPSLTAAAMPEADLSNALNFYQHLFLLPKMHTEPLDKFSVVHPEQVQK